MIFRDGRQVDTYSVSYSDVKNGTVPHRPLNNRLLNLMYRWTLIRMKEMARKVRMRKMIFAYHWDNGNNGNGKGNGKGNDND